MMYRFKSESASRLVDMSKYNKMVEEVSLFMYKHHKVQFKNTKGYTDLDIALDKYPEMGLIIREYKSKTRYLHLMSENCEILKDMSERNRPSEIPEEVFSALCALRFNNYWNTKECEKIQYVIQLYHGHDSTFTSTIIAEVSDVSNGVTHVTKTEEEEATHVTN